MDLFSAAKRSLPVFSFVLIAAFFHLQASAQTSIFPQRQQYTTPTDMSLPLLGDFNGDHQPDVAYIAVPSQSPANIVVLLGQGSSLYSSPIQTSTTCTSITSLVAADMERTATST